MRWCAHGITQTACGGGARWRAPNGGSFRRRGSLDQIAAKPSPHAVPPTVCGEGLAEMWIRALERGARPPRDVRPHRAKVNLFVTLFGRNRNATTRARVTRGVQTPERRQSQRPEQGLQRETPVRDVRMKCGAGGRRPRRPRRTSARRAEGHTHHSRTHTSHLNRDIQLFAALARVAGGRPPPTPPRPPPIVPAHAHHQSGAPADSVMAPSGGGPGAAGAAGPLANTVGWARLEPITCRA